jgi:hypothetical protein
MKKRYTDEFRTGCVLMLTAAGYEETPTRALTIVSKSQKVPESTLRSWWNRLHNTGKRPSAGMTPVNLYDEKKFDLRAAIKLELEAVFGDADNVRQDASYRDLMWAAGVLIDKDQLLDGKPTAIIKLQEALEKGDITPDQLQERYPHLATRVLRDNISA